MSKNNFYISFGIWVAIIPFLGIPRTGRDVFVVLSGLFLVSIFYGPTILKKLQTKSKSKKNNPLNPPYLKGEIGNPSPLQGEGQG